MVSYMDSQTFFCS